MRKVFHMGVIIGKVLLVGVMLAATFIMNCIGTLICAITD